MSRLAASEREVERLRAENATLRAAQKACEDCDAPTMGRIAEVSAALADALAVLKALGIENIRPELLPLGHEYDGGNVHENEGDDYCWETVSMFGHGDCTRTKASHEPDPAAIAAFARLKEGGRLAE